MRNLLDDALGRRVGGHCPACEPGVVVQHPLLSANVTVLFKAHRPIDDAVFQIEKIFFEAVDVLTIHAKQIPVLSYLKSLTCFFQ